MEMTDLSILCKWEIVKNRQCIKYLFSPLYACAVLLNKLSGVHFPNNEVTR